MAGTKGRIVGYHWKEQRDPSVDAPSAPGFDPDVLSRFDLTIWTPVAVRERRTNPDDVKPWRWRTLEGSPIGEVEAKAGHAAGWLLKAVRYEQDTEVIVVKLTKQAREALAPPSPHAAR
jgi:hypothetical protein